MYIRSAITTYGVPYSTIKKFKGKIMPNFHISPIDILHGVKHGDKIK